MPTFGNTYRCYAESDVSGNIFALIANCPEAGLAQSIFVYVNNRGTSAKKMKCALYDDPYGQDSYPVTIPLVASTNEVSIPAGFNGWQEFPFPSPVQLSAKTYDIACWGEGPAGSNLIVFYTGDPGNAGGQRFDSRGLTLAYGNWPDPWSPSDYWFYSMLSMYASYGPLGPVTPVANFIYSISGADMLTAAFTDMSSNNPTSWLWDFGDGATSTQQNPTHVYSTRGNYTVKLTATNSAGSNTAQKTITMGNWPPVASFTFSQSGPLSISFLDTSSGNPTSWLWDFGDGQTSTQRNPSHSYAAAGTYNVTLTSTNSAGSNTSSPTAVVVTAATGAIYHVATSGNDSTGNGSQASPWRTIGHASAMVKAGDTVLVHAGTYSESIVLSVGGTQSSPITFIPNPGDAVIISGGGSGYVGFRIPTGCNYNTIKGFTIQGYQYGVILGSDDGNFVEGCVIDGNTIQNITTQGIFVQGARAMTIQNNKFLNPNITVGEDNDAIAFAYSGNASDGYHKILNNVIDGRPNGGWWDGIGGGGFTMNAMHRGLAHDSEVAFNLIIGVQDDCIETECAGVNNRIHHNILIGSWNNGISAVPITVGPTYIYRNLVLDCGQGCVKIGSGDAGYAGYLSVGTQYWYQNTFVNRTGEGAILVYGDDPHIQNLVMYNNIIQGSIAVGTPSGLDVEQWLFDDNLVNGNFRWGQASHSWADWLATGQEAHGIWGQASFVNGSETDPAKVWAAFALKAGSLGIAMGRVLPSGWPDPDAVTQPSIGAIEYGGQVTQYTLTLSPVSGSGSYLVNGSTVAAGNYSYPANTVLSIQAVPASGWQLDHFEYDSTTGVSNPLSLNMTTNIMVKAVFVQQVVQYTLTMQAATGGTTTPAPGNYQYDQGTVVPLTATPNSGYTFSGWYAGSTSLGAELSINITMNSNITITPVFTPIQVTYTLTIQSTTGGITSPAAGTSTRNTGDQVQITATPSSGYKFVQWLEGATVLGTDNPITITMNANRTITPVFALIQYNLTVNAGQNGSTNPAPGSYKINQGAQATVTATPDAGYKFDHWIVGSSTSTDNPLILVMNQDISVTPVFVQITYTLTIGSATGGTTNPAAGNYTENAGAQVQITATPNSKYRFVEWRSGGKSLGSANPITVTMDGDKSISPFFVAVVRLSISIVGNGTTAAPFTPGDYDVDTGTLINLDAVASAGSMFDHWEGNISATSPQINFYANQDIVATAVFTQIVVPPAKHSVTINVVGGGITTPAAGAYTVDDGSYLDIAATPVSGWKFDHWEDASSDTTPSIHVGPITGDIALTAVFTAEVIPQAKPVPSWVLPTAISGGLALTLLVATVVLRRR